MNLTQIFIVILFLFNFSLSSIAQSNIDSLEAIYSRTTDKAEQVSLAISIAKSYLNAKKAEQAEVYQNKALEAAKTLNNFELARKAHVDVAYIYIAQLKYKKGLEVLSEGIKYATQPNEKALINGYQFDLKYRMGKPDEGMQYLEQMRSHIGNDTLSTLMAEYYFGMSNYYGSINDVLKKLDYLKKAKSIFQYNEAEYHKVKHNMAIVYENIQAYDKVLEIQAELLAYTQEHQIYFSELYCYYAIMLSHYGLKDYEAVKATCQKAIDLKEKHDVSSMFGYTYFILGNTYLETDQLDSAEYFYNQGVTISQNQNEESELFNNYKGLTKLFSKKKEWNNTKEYGEKALALIDYVDTELNYLLAQVYEKEGHLKKSNQLLKANWENQIEKEESQSNFKIIASLLNEQHEQEKQQEALAYEQNLQRQKQYFVGGILMLGLFLATIIIFLQVRNNRKLQLLNRQLQDTNQQLEQANYELRTFNYIASHDIKEPIRNVGNYAGLIFRKLPDDLKTSLGSYFEIIKRSTSQLYTLVEDFARYTKLSRDESIQKQPVDLNELVDSLENALGTTIQKYNGKIINHGLPIIQSSSSLVYTTLKNLIENGLKYNKSTTPTVEINYGTTEITEISGQAYHQIIVSDNGIGISEEYHEKIFEMFKRLHNRGEYEGSGIGLAIVKLSMDKLGGHLTVKSEEGKGSIFTLLLSKEK